MPKNIELGVFKSLVAYKMEKGMTREDAVLWAKDKTEEGVAFLEQAYADAAPPEVMRKDKQQIQIPGSMSPIIDDLKWPMAFQALKKWAQS